MLSEEDYAQACRRYKDRRTKLLERQRYHALILVTQGYSYREVGRILLADEESISQWVALYQRHGLDGVKNHPGWGGEHGQRMLDTSQVEALTRDAYLRSDAGHKVGQWMDCQSHQKTDS